MKDRWMMDEYLIKYMQHNKVSQSLGAFDLLHLAQINASVYNDRDCKN